MRWWLIACLVCGARIGSASVTPPTVLRTLAAIRNLTPAEAGRGLRVQVRGIVTYSETDPLIMPTQDFFLLGAYAGLYVKGLAGTHFKPGDQVEVVGLSATGEFAPVIKASQVRRLGHTPLPPAPLTTGAALISGSEDAQWIRLQGTVHQVIAAGARTAVKLMVGNTLVRVLIAPSSGGLSVSDRAGIGSLVTVFGVVKTLYNSQRQNLGFEVWVPSLKELHLDQAGPTAPFALPLDDIAALVRFDPRGGSRRLWHVQGVVTLRSAARKDLFVQSNSGGVFLPDPQAPTLRVGDLADVVGFPITSAGKPILVDAVVHRVGRAKPPDPLDVTPDTALLHDAQLVQINGHLLRRATDGPGIPVLEMQTHSGTFLVSYEDLGDREPPDHRPQLGALLHVVGVCTVGTNEEGAPLVFRVLLRGPQDITVLRGAPWWNMTRLRSLLVSLALLVLIVVVWSATLRRRLAHQGATILQHQSVRSSLEEQLQRAQKLEAIGRLAGGVAHDFNNLLTIVKGQAELLHYQVPPNSPMAERLRRIEEAAQRGATLTRQLLAFGRQQKFQPVSLDLNQLLPGLKSMLHSLLGDEIEIRLQLEPRLRHIWADPTQLEQVVLNLAVNARDAMPQGGHLTIVTAMRQLPSKLLADRNLPAIVPWVELRVSDTGHGMDEATMTRIFEPFFTTKDEFKGTGLGLATVYGIVAQCGGKIDVISKPHQGASFSLFFPPHVADQDDAERRVAAATES